MTTNKGPTKNGAIAWREDWIARELRSKHNPEFETFSEHAAGVRSIVAMNRAEIAELRKLADDASPADVYRALIAAGPDHHGTYAARLAEIEGSNG